MTWNGAMSPTRAAMRAAIESDGTGAFNSSVSCRRFYYRGCALKLRAPQVTRSIDMRVLVQRVSEASVMVDGDMVSRIGPGLLLLVGIRADDATEDFDWLAKKVVNLRIFNDETGVMNRSALDTGGDVLAVSQFTLYASTQKGNRPSYSNAAPASVAAPLFERFVAVLASLLGRPVQTGVFGADMKVGSINDGPVTIWLDSRARE
jgi:D-tyrosyl-tRNA(Tyr) deacylase